MSDPFLGEIKMAGWNFAANGYALCNGQTLAINQNAALFSLLGTQYGGNGTSTFQLPNMQGRMPMHQGNGPGLTPRVMGELAGTENVSILISNMPSHTHVVTVGGVPASTAPGTSGTPSSGAVPAASTARDKMYGAPDNSTTLAAPTVTAALTGNSIPLSIMPPFLVVNFIIALVGIFPSRN